MDRERDLDGALEYTRRALAILESVFGSENPRTRIAAGNLAALLALKGSERAGGA